MRKITKGLALFLSLVLMLLSVPALAEDVTITVALMSSDWLDAAEQIAEDFTAKYGIKVDYVAMPENVKAVIMKSWGEIKDTSGKSIALK